MCIFIYALEELPYYRYNDLYGNFAASFPHSEIVFIGAVYRHWNGADPVQHQIFAIRDDDVESGVATFQNWRIPYGQRRVEHTRA